MRGQAEQRAISDSGLELLDIDTVMDNIDSFRWHAHGCEFLTHKLGYRDHSPGAEKCALFPTGVQYGVQPLIQRVGRPGGIWVVGAFTPCCVDEMDGNDVTFFPCDESVRLHQIELTAMSP